MNIDAFSYVNTSASVSPAWHYASGGYALFCLLCGSISNGLVIFVFIRNSNLRQPRNFLLINLAVTDLGLLLTNNSLHIIASFNKQWPFGQIGCSFYALCGGICSLTSIATMAAIAITRLVAVVDPFSTLKLTEHFTLKCIVCSWIYGSMWMIPPLFGWNRFVFEGFGTSCTFDYISKDGWNRLFIIMLMIGGFLIPLTVIIISYTFIVRKLSRRSRRLLYSNYDRDRTNFPLKQANMYRFMAANLANDDVSLTESKSSFETTNSNQITRIVNRTEARATRTALLVCAIYCITWTSYALMAILSQIGFDHLINAYTASILGLFAKTGACINSLIYALSSSIFRRHMYHCLKCLHTSRARSYPLSSSYYDLNRRQLTLTINGRPSPSDWSQQ